LKAPLGSTTQPPEGPHELLAFEGEFLYIPWHEAEAYPVAAFEKGDWQCQLWGLTVLEIGLDCETAGRDVE
jgi:hypothetical protein